MSSGDRLRKGCPPKPLAAGVEQGRWKHTNPAHSAFRLES